MVSRRNFLGGAGVAAAAASTVSKVAMAALPEPVIQTRPDTMAPLLPPTGRPYNPVVTLNGWTLPWRMHNGIKEFHLVAEPVVREIAPAVRVIDLTHEIEPHDVRGGGLALARSAQYLAPGVVLAVVDPGVGSSRRAIAIEVGDGSSVLVGPDNRQLAPPVAPIPI